MCVHFRYFIFRKASGEQSLLAIIENKMYSIHRQKYKKIISMLVERRKAAGITQKQLASKIHLRQVIISKIETCERRIDLLELIYYCGG